MRRTFEPAKPTVPLQIRLDPQLAEDFAAMAESLGISRSEWLRQQIMEALNAESTQAKVDKPRGKV